MHSYNIPTRLPILPVRNVIVLPGETLRAKLTDQSSMRLIEDKLSRQSLVSTLFGLVPVSKKQISMNSDLDGKIGTIIVISQIASTNWPQPSYSLLMTGLCRFAVEDVIQENPYPLARIKQVDLDGADNRSEVNKTKIAENDPELKSLMEEFRQLTKKLFSLVQLSHSKEAEHIFNELNRLPSGHIVDLTAAMLNPTMEEKLEILNAVDLKERLKKTLNVLKRKLEIFNHRLPRHGPLLPSLVGNERSSLRGAYHSSDEMIELETKLAEAQLPENVAAIIDKEVKRLAQMNSMMPDHAILKNYLEFVADLPWKKSTVDETDLNKAKRILDEDHFGLSKPKRRVMEFLAVRLIKSHFKGPILCLVGPPGVGKTSIGRSLARALNRKFHRISLGGVCDQSTIRGHRRTYIGSMAGQILQGLRNVGSRNPVFLLDEIDKLNPGGMHGDPVSALLEVLDPEQNNSFNDHYLGLPFDLSQVLFVATANTAATIPQPLRDRMEVIEIGGYTEEEKLSIAKKYLLPKQLDEHGLTENEMIIPDQTIRLIIDQYTREAGVRNLERCLSALCRAVTVSVARARSSSTNQIDDNTSQFETKIPEFPVVIDSAALEDILGPGDFQHEALFRVSQPGVAIGLVFTEFGGEITFVEASALPGGSGTLSLLTGSLGKVIQESARLALSWIRANAGKLQLDTSWLSKHDFHIHLPCGAVSKEGPSAGVTLTVALLSTVWQVSVRSDTGMTGEITLRGAVLPVGGVKEKLLAAHRAGLARVIIPSACRKEIPQLPQEVKDNIQFLYVSTIEEAIVEAFELSVDKRRTILNSSDATSLISKL